MRPTVLMIGTFDTKAAEFQFLRERLLEQGANVLAVNVGINGSTDLFSVAVEADVVAEAGGESPEALRAKNDRGNAISVMSKGIETVVTKLYTEGAFHAMIGMGGSGGTGIVTAAMRAIPFGVPKVCVSTLASGDVSPFVAEKEIVMFPSVADIAGINRISRTIFTQAAAAVCGMAKVEIPEESDDRPIIAASMFGNTTQCVDECRRLLGEQGIESLVFHATGAGGRVLESLAKENLVDAVLDITTTEWADELCGGVLSAGPDRLSGPGQTGIPHLIVPGCIDMCNFGPMKTVPQKYRSSNRLFYEWTPEITLMRTNVEENQELGTIFAEKANAAHGPVAFLIPKNGFSILDGEGELFCDREADRAFVESLKASLNPDVAVVEMDANINDAAFSARAVELIQSFLE